MGRMFVGLGALLVITAVMSFFMIKGDRERVDQANAKLREQQAEMLNVGDTVLIESLEFRLKSAEIDNTTENSALLKLELTIINTSDEPISLEASDFILYNLEGKAITPSKSQEEESSWQLDYKVNSDEQFILHVAADKLNEGAGATFRLNPEQS